MRRKRAETEDPLEAEVDGILNRRFRVFWQVYLEEWDVWKQYTATQSQQIEAAWRGMAREVEVEKGHGQDGTWNVNLVSMTQLNPYTGVRRDIQRILKTHG